MMTPKHSPEVAAALAAKGAAPPDRAAVDAETARLQAASAVFAALADLPRIDAYRVLGWCYGRSLHHEDSAAVRRSAAMNFADAFEIGRTA